MVIYIYVIDTEQNTSRTFAMAVGDKRHCCQQKTLWKPNSTVYSIDGSGSPSWEIPVLSPIYCSGYLWVIIPKNPYRIMDISGSGKNVIANI